MRPRNQTTPAHTASWLELDSCFANRLREGCAQLRLAVDAVQLEQLERYLTLLSKWNRAYNLTAVRDEEQMVTRHLLDSLAIAGHLWGRRLIDVGTGAGLPGVPMAILFPEREFHLLDSNGKKTRFLFQVKTALGLDNMTVHQARVETFCPDILFDSVLSRAFAGLQDMVRDCRHLLHSDGRFLAMKGAYPRAELSAVSRDCTVLAVYPLAVPGLNEQRHLVELALRQIAQQPK